MKVCSHAPRLNACKGTRRTVRKMGMKRTISSWGSSFREPRRGRRREEEKEDFARRR